ncbi:hypothetical protein [Thioclava sp. GXIMD2076]|uniref:Uncharacterized protein n=1 Tax=Thioclava kandeliae TaxID=3070818 RepID=A0ABV1SEM3_9RHOB
MPQTAAPPPEDMSRDEALRREYETALALHKFVIEPERDAVMFESFKAYRALMARLDAALPQHLEPGPVWTPAPVVASVEKA